MTYLLHFRLKITAPFANLTPGAFNRINAVKALRPMAARAYTSEVL